MNHEPDDFLTRFLSDVDKEIMPSLADLKAVSDALIQMHDYGVSFKRAFSLADNRGLKAKNKTMPIVSQSESFQSMSKGFLGVGFPYLNRFLSDIDQGKQQEIENLRHVANALTKMRDHGESIKSAFGILQKTGHKEFCKGNKIDFKLIYQSEEWIIYHSHKKLRLRKTYEETIAFLAELYNFSDSKVKRMVRETIKEEHHVLRAKNHAMKYWKFYFSNRKVLNEKTAIEAISNISHENKCSEWETCTKLANLYEEVIVKKRYPLVIRGTRG